MQARGTLTDRFLKLLYVALIPVVLFVSAPPVFASSDELGNRFDKISGSTASATVTHRFGFDITNTTAPIGSISFQFCSNTPIIGDPCDPSSGLNVSGAVLAAQQGETGFTLSGLSDSSHLILTRPATLPAGGHVEYQFDNIIDPDHQASYYVRIQTFTSTDATGADIESGGVVFYVVLPLDVSAEVPPYLKFCAAVTITGYDCSTATSYLIDFGEFSKTQPSKGSSEMVAATNAGYGYSVTVSGTTLTSGNDIIPALFPGSGSSPGTSQFGLNLRTNSNPSIGVDPQGPGVAATAVDPAYDTPNLFGFRNNDTLVTAINSSDNTKFTLSYMVNIGASQAPGIYVTTLTYICLANF